MPDEITSLDGATEAALAASATPATESETPVQPAGDTHTPEQWTALMAESKANRERAQEYDKLYGQNSELRQFHEAAQAYADGDIDKTQEFILANAAALQGLTLDEYMEKFAEPEDEDDKPLTRREWKALQKEQEDRQVQAATQVQVGEIQAQAEDLGYEVGSREYNDLLWVAMNQTGNDLDKAHEIVSTTEQKIIDGFVKEQRDKARAGLRPSPAARVPGTDREITNWKDAEAAAEEFLASRL